MAKLLLIKVKSYDLLYLLSRMNHKAGLAEHTVPLNPLINYHYTHIVATLAVRAFSDAPTYHIVVVVVLVAAAVVVVHCIFPLVPIFLPPRMLFYANAKTEASDNFTHITVCFCRGHPPVLVSSPRPFGADRQWCLPMAPALPRTRPTLHDLV